MKEELKYQKKCLYCGDQFLSYRANAKFDTNRCRKKYALENYPAAREGKRRASRRHYQKYRLKLNCKRNTYKKSQGQREKEEARRTSS